MKSILILLFTIFFLSSYSQTFVKSYYPNTKIKVKLPGVVQVNDSLFCDIDEMNNIGYREFYYYKQHYKIFELEDNLSIPDKQINYKPDTLVFGNKDIFEGMFSSGNYWNHPTYSVYPIVGITYQQAIQYSKWRTDMVFEQFLIKQKLIPKMFMNTQAFTIEDYFNGNYRNIKPATRFIYYFEYSLPSEDEWQSICRKFYYKDGKYIGSHRINSTKNFPLNYNSYSKSEVEIWDMQDEVSEMLIDSTIVIGLNWNDSFDIKKIDMVRENTSPTATIGFRNIGKWKKWKY